MDEQVMRILVLGLAFLVAALVLASIGLLLYDNVTVTLSGAWSSCTAPGGDIYPCGDQRPAISW